MDKTIFSANFTITCIHEFCSGSCEWLETGKCILFNQKLKRLGDNAYDEGPDILRCKMCITFCGNLPYEEEETG